MEEYLVANYVKLSSRIFVPKEWPIRGIKKLLLSLAKKVINNDDHDQIVVLQVNDLPTMKVQHKDASGTYHVFEKISHQEIRDAHIIDVVFCDTETVNNSMEAGASTAGNPSAGTADENSNDEISVNNYRIGKDQSDRRTTYYVVPVALAGQMRLGRNTSYAVNPHASGALVWHSLRYEALWYLAEMGIFFIVFIVVVSMIIYKFFKNEPSDDLLQ